MKEVKESEWIQCAKQGDLDALSSLVVIHQDRVFRHALSMLGDVDDAHDITQDVFRILIESIDGFRGEASLGTWLHRVTTNAALMHLRRVKRRRKYEVFPPEAWEACAPTPSTDALVDTRRHLRRVHCAWNELDEDHQKVLSMRGIEGVPMVEMARALGLSTAATKSRIHRARARLKDILDLP